MQATAVKKMPHKTDHSGQLESPSIPVIMIMTIIMIIFLKLFMYIIIVVATAKNKLLVNIIVLFSRFNLNMFQCSAEKTEKNPHAKPEV